MNIYFHAEIIELIPKSVIERIIAQEICTANRVFYFEFVKQSIWRCFPFCREFKVKICTIEHGDPKLIIEMEISTNQIGLIIN